MGTLQQTRSDVVTPEQLESYLNQDITLCSFAQAFENGVLYGAVKYNPKSKLFKFLEGDVVILARTKCDFVCAYYNDYYAAVMRRIV